MEFSEVYNKIFLNFEVYARKCLKIKNKAGEIVSFLLNPAQKKVYNIYKEARKKKKLLRFIVLKARQEGISTLFEAIIYQRTKNQFNRKAQIVAHEDEAATNLFEMFKRFNEHDEAKAEIEHDNGKRLSFKNLLSEIRIKSAERGDQVKRSDTIQDLHATEVAFWRDARATMLALLQTVPDHKNTLIVIESTANGVGGWFHDTWQSAVKGENDFIPIFLGWHELPEYSKPFESADERKRFSSSLNDYEQQIKKQFSLTLEQLNWRRGTIKNKCSGDEELFKQEYPIIPEEAFITTGRPVFDTKIVFARYNESRSPVKVGDLVYTDQTKKEVEFVENGKGFIKLYDDISVKGHEYYVFAAGTDVAEGLEQGDYSEIRVLDRRNKRVVLTWHGHIDADLLAEEQHKISLFLKKKVWFCTEFNNHGISTVYEAYKLQLSQYFREDFDSGKVHEQPKEKLGFKTTGSTKPFIINELNEAIRESAFVDYEQDFWGQCLTFVRNSKGQMSAQGKDQDPATKCFDDKVMAQALMWRLHLWLPNYFKGQEPEPDADKIARPHILKQKRKIGDYKF